VHESDSHGLGLRGARHPVWDGLKNFEALRNRGCYGRLESVVPPLSKVFLAALPTGSSIRRFFPN
jgi:predicted AlkP superfamily phosphohydrolase/phosphomutase